jgi:hypothetical protein
VERSVRFPPDEEVKGMPLKGKLEDFDEPETPNTSDTSDLVVNEDPQPVPLPPNTAVEQGTEGAQLPVLPMVVEEEEGRGRQIQKESAYIQQIHEGKNAITMPRGIQITQEEEIVTGGCWEVEEEDVHCPGARPGQGQLILDMWKKI